ncbi:MAG: phosphotransferase family protein [Proteobacteria bacterium]|nr:phosphotransferase family protein [Pseudomonadota bacterium]
MKEALARFLESQWPEAKGLRVVSLEQGTEGFSQETFFFDVELPTAERRSFVAKREPAAGLLEPYDLEPEFRVLHALSDDPFPSPRTPWFASDPGDLVRPLYVMERMPGSVPLPAPQRDGGPPLDEAARESLTPDVITALSALRRFDWRGAGLEFLGQPAEGVGAAQREWSHWRDRIERAALPVSPVLAEALQWLGRRLPRRSETCLVHGDYRLGNWLVEDRDGRARLAGVLDWEMVHLGDPLEDLAWCISPMWRGGSPWAASLVPAEDFVAEYERRTKSRVDPDDLHWWSVLAVVKMCAIQYTGLRAYVDARTNDPRMAIFDHQLPFLCALLAVQRGWLPEAVLEASR